MKDISFVEEHQKFNFRVAAIIFDEDRSHILIHKKKFNDFWMLPGGRVQFGEDTLNGIKREIDEEIGLSGNFKLAYVCENFFNLNDTEYHEICMFYYMTTHELISDECFIESKENEYEIFKWIPKEEIKNYNIEPIEILGKIDGQESVKEVVIRKK